MIKMFERGRLKSQIFITRRSNQDQLKTMPAKVPSQYHNYTTFLEYSDNRPFFLTIGLQHAVWRLGPVEPQILLQQQQALIKSFVLDSYMYAIFVHRSLHRHQASLTYSLLFILYASLVFHRNPVTWGKSE